MPSASDATAILSGSPIPGVMTSVDMDPHPLPRAQPVRTNSCERSSPRSPMASALHCLQWRIILASSSHRSMSLLRSSGVGARMPANFVPSTGISGRMLTMYAPRPLTSFTRSGITASLIPGTMTMFTFTTIPMSAHMRMPSVWRSRSLAAPSSPVSLLPSKSTES